MGTQKKQSPQNTNLLNVNKKKKQITIRHQNFKDQKTKNNHMYVLSFS
jgi:hypothetical protein